MSEKDLSKDSDKLGESEDGSASTEAIKDSTDAVSSDLKTLQGEGDSKLVSLSEEDPSVTLATGSQDITEDALRTITEEQSHGGDTPTAELKSETLGSFETESTIQVEQPIESAETYYVSGIRSRKKLNKHKQSTEQEDTDTVGGTTKVDSDLIFSETAYSPSSQLLSQESTDESLRESISLSPSTEIFDKPSVFNENDPYFDIIRTMSKAFQQVMYEMLCDRDESKYDQPTEGTTSMLGLAGDQTRRFSTTSLPPIKILERPTPIAVDRRQVQSARTPKEQKKYEERSIYLQLAEEPPSGRIYFERISSAKESKFSGRISKVSGKLKSRKTSIATTVSTTITTVRSIKSKTESRASSDRSLKEKSKTSSEKSSRTHSTSKSLRSVLSLSTASRSSRATGSQMSNRSRSVEAKSSKSKSTPRCITPEYEFYDVPSKDKMESKWDQYFDTYNWNWRVEDDFRISAEKYDSRFLPEDNVSELRWEDIQMARDKCNKWLKDYVRSGVGGGSSLLDFLSGQKR